MKDVANREPQTLTDLFDWFDAGWPALADWRRGAGAMRIEDHVEDGKYTLRAELPGVDPEKDIHVEVDDGVLTVSAERRENVTEKTRSEFRYGSFRRRVSLPRGAQEDSVNASYRDGILEVTVPIDTEQAKPRTVSISHNAENPTVSVATDAPAEG